MEIVREWADRALRDAKRAEILTEEVLNCTVCLLHKGSETSDKPRDWKPIGLLNVCMQFVHHVVNCRLTVITEMENITVPSQYGEPAGRSVDLNQLKLDLITNEPQRLKQRIFRIDIDFKNAFNSCVSTNCCGQFWVRITSRMSTWRNSSEPGESLRHTMVATLSSIPSPYGDAESVRGCRPRPTVIENHDS